MHYLSHISRVLIFTAISAIIVLFSHAAFAAKQTIAVGDIEYRAKDSRSNKRHRAYGQGVREDTRAFIDMMTTALGKTRKFRVIERDRLGEIFKEQGLSLRGFASGGYQGKKFNMQGVDFILMGAITEFGQSASALQVKGFATEAKTARMAVDVRVLNVATGEVELAETVKGSSSASGAFAIKGFASGGSNDAAAALGKVSRKVASNVANLVVAAIYPVKVLTRTGRGMVILNYGNGFLRKGDVLEVFRKGEVLIDPDTKENLGSEEELVGRVSVTSAQAKFSRAKIVKEESPIEKGMIARRIKNEASGGLRVPGLFGGNEN